MNAIVPPQPTPTFHERRMAMTIADFYFKCVRPCNFANPYRKQFNRAIAWHSRERANPKTVKMGRVNLKQAEKCQEELYLCHQYLLV